MEMKRCLVSHRRFPSHTHTPHTHTHTLTFYPHAPPPPPDFDRLFAAADPDLRNMALTATPDGAWSLADPCTRLPAPLPEPTAGVNFAREGMHPTDWAVLVSREGQGRGGRGSRALVERLGGEGCDRAARAAARARARAGATPKKKKMLLGSTLARPLTPPSVRLRSPSTRTPG